ncbi:MAG: phage tail sheath subtilisin-like domain-containing protein [Bacteroidales bacterium]|nr:phage tail sheath subtilisin-like domain-containing protein [Bacteroidales bacterium]
MSYKTPGVYVEEIALFPPSVAQVETAIPAFVGYTGKAEDPNGKDLTDLPVKIKSLVEFESLFGTAYTPESFRIVTDETKRNAIVSITPSKHFFLYESMRQFYDNGGGNCYIVSVGSYEDNIEFAALKAGFDTLRKYDEPTLLLSPDAVGLLDGDDEPDLAQFAELQKLALKQCADLQDRFAILDVMQGHLAEDVVSQPVSDFRDSIGINSLNYGAAYYPWVISSYNHKVGLRQLQFFDVADLDTEIVDLTEFSNNTNENALLEKLAETREDSDAVTDITEPQIDLNELRARGVEYIREQLVSYRSAIAADQSPIVSITAYLNLLAGLVGSFEKSDIAADAGSNFHKDVQALKINAALTDAIKHLVSIEKNPATLANSHANRDAAALEALYEFLETEWFGGDTYAAIAADGTPFSNDNTGRIAIIDALSATVDVILQAYQGLLSAALFYEDQAEKAIFASHTFFHGVNDKVTEYMRTLPPSAAIAGVYATIDRTRGVWKAPANISLNSVIGPAVKIDSRDQESLNVHTTGKSVNAIRAFAGKGTLVWGARTLAGNDNEWRYVPVRRFFIMVEQSTKKASEPFVFEPNDANTWVKVRAMIENFLILQWRAGALQGAKPEDAFFVRVGLGETMTELDILEGRMIVEIGMAVVRPAEFIILRFSHKMLTGNA